MTHRRERFARFPLTGGILVLTLSVSGCADGRFTKSDMGNILGGALGGFVGSQFGSGSGQLLGTALGTMGGWYLGGWLGGKLDERDEQLLRDAARRALDGSGDAAWANPDSGNSGSVQVASRYEEDGNPCAMLHYTVDVGGSAENARQSSCRLAGSDDWEFGAFETI